MHKKVIGSFVLVLILLIGILAGCGSSEKTETTDVDLGSRLQIQATRATEEMLGGSIYGDDSVSVHYSGLSELSIWVEDDWMELGTAISEGYITPEEIFAYARLDAASGACKMKVTSQNGLSIFTYSYSDFDLSIVYDVYETPDGSQHLIHTLNFYEPGGAEDVSTGYYEDDGDFLYPIDQEDWGLEFGDICVSATGLELDCQQTGGQQLGQLVVTSYVIVDEQTGTFLSALQGVVTTTEDPNYQEITMDGNSIITIDWAEKYGEIPAGSYVIKIWITDEYDVSTVHPLMKNYHDTQGYSFRFTVA